MTLHVAVDLTGVDPESLRGVHLDNRIRTVRAWPYSHVRGKVREGDVPPPAQSAEAKYFFESIPLFPAQNNCTFITTITVWQHST